MHISFVFFSPGYLKTDFFSITEIVILVSLYDDQRIAVTVFHV